MELEDIFNKFKNLDSKSQKDTKTKFQIIRSLIKARLQAELKLNTDIFSETLQIFKILLNELNLLFEHVEKKLEIIFYVIHSFYAVKMILNSKNTKIEDQNLIQQEYLFLIFSCIKSNVFGKGDGSYYIIKSKIYFFKIL